MLNFMDAHAPYEPPDEFRTRFNQGKTEQDRYDGGIAYEDSIIGSIVERLRQRGDLEHTVLIVTADHGEQFGEHGLGSHGNSLYLPLLHVPLLVHAPGRVPAGQRIAPIVSLRDMAATLVDLAGAPAGSMPGTSFAQAWTTGSNDGMSPMMAEAAEVVNPSNVNLTRFGPIKATHRFRRALSSTTATGGRRSSPGAPTRRSSTTWLRRPRGRRPFRATATSSARCSASAGPRHAPACTKQS